MTSIDDVMRQEAARAANAPVKIPPGSAVALIGHGDAELLRSVFNKDKPLAQKVRLARSTLAAAEMQRERNPLSAAVCNAENKARHDFLHLRAQYKRLTGVWL